jgi:hypothetical protein
MRKGGGKAKGAQFEREVCVALSKWVSRNTKEDVFWRSAMSGGRATVQHNRSGKKFSNQVGDISCIDPIGHKFMSCFAVECKYYANLDFQGIITGKGKLLAFWKEIISQAYAHGKRPFLVARQNRMPTLVCIQHTNLTNFDLAEHQTVLISRPYDLYILEFDYFVREATPFV